MTNLTEIIEDVFYAGWAANNEITVHITDREGNTVGRSYKLYLQDQKLKYFYSPPILTKEIFDEIRKAGETETVECTCGVCEKIRENYETLLKKYNLGDENE